MFDFSRNAARYFRGHRRNTVTDFLRRQQQRHAGTAAVRINDPCHWVQPERQRKSVPGTGRPSACRHRPPTTSWTSNGPLWVTTVAARYGAAVNPSLQGRHQLRVCRRAYRRCAERRNHGATAGHRPEPGAADGDPALRAVGFAVNPQNLVIVDAGGAFGNNVKAALALVLANPANATTIVTATVTAAVTDVVGILTRLYAAGARNILLLNSPNLGATPAAIATEQSAGATLLTQMSGGFNANIATQVNNLRAVSPGLNIYLIDAFALQSQVAGESSGLRICQCHAALLRPGHGDNAADPLLDRRGRSEHVRLLGSFSIRPMRLGSLSLSARSRRSVADSICCERQRRLRAPFSFQP